MAKILVHMCCAPCFMYPLEKLEQDGHKIVGYFYNPNIYPVLEFEKRKESVKFIKEKKKIDIIISEEHKCFEQKEDRCQFCYQVRLEEVGRLAKIEKFDYFTTTLLVSPYQKHKLLVEIGYKISQDIGIKFYYEDFRQKFYESKKIAKDLGLYLQKYCGCIYSKKEK